ncbi:MAG: AAA family ATPase, partial [Thermodesulfobacteriota bacterium]
ASAFVLSRPQPQYRRFLHRIIDFHEPMICVKGARGGGKTTLILQYALASGLPLEKVLYAACDHPAMVDVDLYGLAQTFYQEGGKLLLLDEIHKVKGFGRMLKAIRDTFDLQVIFSGSSALRIDHELADLSRRAIVHELPVLSLREFMEIETGLTFARYPLEEILSRHQAIAAEVGARIRPIEYLRKYLRYGAYPFFRESIPGYPQKLLEVVNITIDSDLSGLYNIEPVKVDKLKKILYMLCSTPPVELNKSKLSAAVGASWPTLSKYLERMHAGALLHLVRAGSGMRALNRPDKLLLNNPNLFFVLCSNPNIGAIRESFFVSQLAHCHQVHYHDQGDFVIDDRFVCEIGGPGKTPRQLGRQTESYVVADDIETGAPGQVPLWVLGMGY